MADRLPLILPFAISQKRFPLSLGDELLQLQARLHLFRKWLLYKFHSEASYAFKKPLGARQVVSIVGVHSQMHFVAHMLADRLDNFDISSIARLTVHPFLPAANLNLEGSVPGFYPHVDLLLKAILPSFGILRHEIGEVDRTVIYRHVAGFRAA